MQTINCISAESLRKKQKDFTDERCQKQLRAIGEKLEKASNNFDTYIYVDSVYPSVRKELESLGYTVSDCSSQKDGPLFCIEW